MNWKEIYPKFNKRNEKISLDFALACFDSASSYTSNVYVLDTINLIKNGANKQDIRNRLNQIRLIRRNTIEKNEKEAAHIVLHVIEVAISNNHISAAGHASRCGDALFRINTQLGNEVLNRY